MEGHLTMILFVLQKGRNTISVQNLIILRTFAFPTQKENQRLGKINTPKEAKFFVNLSIQMQLQMMNIYIQSKQMANIGHKQ